MRIQSAEVWVLGQFQFPQGSRMIRLLLPPKSRKPWPWNTLPEPHPADWGIGMTVCIAAHCFRGGDDCSSVSRTRLLALATCQRIIALGKYVISGTTGW
jgi:hypothetical protein